MEDAEQRARVTADITRVAIAYLRAIRDDNDDDASLILQGVLDFPPETIAIEFPMRLAQIALACNSITDELLDGFVKKVGELEASGWIAERIAATEDPSA